MRVITYAHVWSNDASPRFIRYLPYLAAGCGAGSAARRTTLPPVVQPAKSCTTTRQNIEIVSFFNRFNNTWKLKAPTQCADTLRRKGLLHVHAIPEISAQPANADGGSLAMLAKESIR